MRGLRPGSARGRGAEGFRLCRREGEIQLSEGPVDGSAGAQRRLADEKDRIDLILTGQTVA
jgi:hypothetical protein